MTYIPFITSDSFDVKVDHPISLNHQQPSAIYTDQEQEDGVENEHDFYVLDNEAFDIDENENGHIRESYSMPT